MPFYKDAMSIGNLYLDFEVIFPKKGELKNVEELKKVKKRVVDFLIKQILPVPKNLTPADPSKAIILEDFDKDSVNSRAEGGRGKAEDEEDEEEGMPRGQRVQCSQQ